MKAVNRAHEYVIGWVPARTDDEYTVIIYDQTDDEVVRFGRLTARRLRDQVTRIFDASVGFNGATVPVIGGLDESLIHHAELRGVYVHKIKLRRPRRLPRTRT